MASTGEASAARMPALDGVRGIAVALVVVHHIGGIPWLNNPGAEGVTIFFVLSGYLISRILLRELDDTGRVDFRRFYLRRAARLFPALVLVLVAAALLVPDPGLHVALAGTYLMDFALVGGLIGSPLGHTWSLAVEEQFYLVWPVVLLAAVRLRLRLARTILVLFVALTAWRLVAMLWLDYTRVYFAPDTNAYALLAGCVLAVLELRGRLPRLGAAPAVVATMVILPMVAIPGFGRDLWGSVVVVPIAAVMIASARSAPWFLMIPALRWIGRVSYGLYLWHWLLFALVPSSLGRVALLPAALLITWASFRFVETPILAAARRVTSEPDRLDRDLRVTGAPRGGAGDVPGVPQVQVVAGQNHGSGRVDEE